MAKRRKTRWQPRSLTSLSRRLGKKSPRKTVLIVCEGQKTEPLYFRSLCRELRLSSIEVQIVGQGAAPITVVDAALEKQQASQADSAPFDEIWCVFDREHQHTNPSFFPAVNKARDHHLNLAVSNPAFELWYLLHFTETSHPFSNYDELARSLKNYLPDYEKGVYWFEQFFSQTQVAITRAERIFSHRPDPTDKFPNPSTNVGKLVQALLDIVRV